MPGCRIPSPPVVSHSEKHDRTTCFSLRASPLSHIAVWIAALVGVIVLGGVVTSSAGINDRLDGTDSQRAYDLAEAHMPSVSGLRTAVVFKSNDLASTAAVIDEIRALPRIDHVDSPIDHPEQIGPGGISFAAVDSALLREGIARLLNESGHEVVGQLIDATTVVASDAELHPDLVVLDVRLPPTFTDEGIRAALAVRAAAPTQPILVLSQYVEERYATELLASESPPAARCWIQKSSPNCWLAGEGVHSTTSRHENARCWG